MVYEYSRYGALVGLMHYGVLRVIVRSSETAPTATTASSAAVCASVSTWASVGVGFVWVLLI